jgi:ABC-type phosphate transport system substrate-binding protein
MRIVTLVGVASFTVACAAGDHVAADRPPAPTTSANTAVVMATGATSTPAATSAVTPATSSNDQAETVDQSLVKRGYRPRRRNGQLLYCRSETLTGTHFSNTVCLTEAQIKASDRNTESTLGEMNRPGKTACLNNTCN